MFTICVEGLLWIVPHHGCIQGCTLVIPRLHRTVIHGSAVYIYLGVSLERLVWELSDKRVLLQQVFLVNWLDLRLNLLVNSSSSPIVFDHFLVDKGCKWNLDTFSDRINVNFVLGLFACEDVWALTAHYLALRQVVIWLFSDFCQLIEWLRNDLVIFQSQIILSLFRHLCWIQIETSSEGSNCVSQSVNYGGSFWRNRVHWVVKKVLNDVAISRDLSLIQFIRFHQRSALRRVISVLNGTV